MAAADTADFIGYLFGFWLFIFSRKFRAAWLGEWQAGGLPERMGLAYEAVVAVLLGVALPVGLVCAVL